MPRLLLTMSHQNQMVRSQFTFRAAARDEDSIASASLLLKAGRVLCFCISQGGDGRVHEALESAEFFLEN